MKAVAKGKVYLVGAGPGDPQLITVKGLKCLSDADVIVYDRLVDDRLLVETCADKETIYVGKSSHTHAMKQSQINDLLVSKAAEGKIVVRLKGGDPFVLGRGGEEAEALAARGIPFEIVPGVTAATAVPAYAGIPVTHRGLASSFAVITGHEDPLKSESSISWDKLATGVDTLVFLMGVEQLPQIVQQLSENGRPSTTPIALIQEGAGPRQQTITGTLADIEAKVAEKKLRPPAVIVVGSVVHLREKLRWFDKQPLFGKRILVTRARSQASKLSRLLTEHGAEPIEIPAIEIEEMLDNQELEKALRAISSYDWLIFTSVNGVDAFFNCLHRQALDTRELKGIKIGAIGPATAEALEKHGIRADYIPPEYTTKGIIEGFRQYDVSGKRILLPRAELAGSELVQELTRLGAEVDQVAIYRTVLPSDDPSRIKHMLLAREFDITTFTSSSTVRNLISLLGDEWPVLNRTTIACIGPVTAATATEAGLKVDILPEEHTIPGLVRAIAERYR